MANRFTLTPYDGFAVAWSWDWPGLVCGAESVDGIAGQMPLAIAEYGAWLAERGEAGPEAGSWEIAETVDPAVPEPTEGDPAYRGDLLPLADAEFESVMRHAAYSQEDLRRVSALPPAILDWAPGGLTVEHPDPWAPDPRTIRGILTHALQLEVFYRDGLKDGRAAGIFERIDDPKVEQERTLAAIREAAMAGLDRVWHPRRPHPLRPDGGVPGDWTVRKVLRRLISHNRAHAAEIVQRRTWILHGVPKSGRD